jgi:uncharacterized protein YkwD
MSRSRRYRASSQGLTRPVVFSVLGILALATAWQVISGRAVPDPPLLLEAQRLLRQGDGEGATRALRLLDRQLEEDAALDAAGRRRIRQRMDPARDNVRRLKDADAEVEKLLVDGNIAADALEETLRQLARPRQEGDLRALAAGHRLAALGTAGPAPRPIPAARAPGVPDVALSTAPDAGMAMGTAGSTAPASQPRPAPAAARLLPSDVLDLLGRVDRLVSDRQFRAAREILRQGVVEAGEAGEPLKTRLVRLAEECDRYCDALLAEAEQMRASGQLLQAVTRLDQESWRFLEGPAATRISQRIEELSAEIRARPPVVDVAPGDPEAWKHHAADAAEQEKHAHYAEARDLYRKAALGAKASEPSVARDFERFAEEADLLDHLVRTLENAIAAEPSRWRGIPVANGRRGDATAADDVGVTLIVGGDSQKTAWSAFTPEALCEMLPRARPDPRAWLGLGLLCLRAGQTERGERVLVKALEADPLVQGGIDSILARIRGETAPRGGYTFHEGHWIARADRDVEVLARQIDQRLGSILKLHDPRQRESAFEKLIRSLVSSPDALVVALHARRTKEVEVLTKAAAPLARAHEQLAARHQELEQRRRSALELIFDEAKYFYPFNPPEVPPEKAKLYWPVQQEVDDRVAAVREVWNDTKVVLRVPASVRSGVDVLQWIDARLGELGEKPETEATAIAWILALPDDSEVVSVRNFSAKLKDKARHKDARRIVRFNELVQTQLPAPERENLQLTNDYRMMLGRMPVALNPKLVQAARGHCEEMAKLGYFSHFSPTPGRRTPFERMQLAGYNEGVSENIAINGSAAGAHQSWLHSAGHHRNILGAGHREFACGNHGNLFTQNFGVATEYKSETAWLEGKDINEKGKPKAKK